jgi:hypothetical protein
MSKVAHSQVEPKCKLIGQPRARFLTTKEYGGLMLNAKV